jgi:hypothetical protein
MAGNDPTNVRELAELLAERLGATSGTRRVTLIFRDGSYVDGYHQERLTPRLLELLPSDLIERIRSGQT